VSDWEEPGLIVALVGETVTVGPVTVIDLVAVQPALFLYWIVEDPADTPVTTPPELTVAIEVFEDVHGEELLAVPDPVNVMLLPLHNVADPETVGAAGSVNVMVLTCLQELLSVTVIV